MHISNTKSDKRFTKEEILRLIEEGEGTSIEFKRETGDLKQLLRTISAFANTFGGYIIIGVDDEGKIVGADITDKILQEIGNSIVNAIKPSIDTVLQKIKISDKTLLVIKVNASDRILHYYSTTPYKRVGSQDFPMDYLEIMKHSKRIKIPMKSAFILVGILMLVLVGTYAFSSYNSNRLSAEGEIVVSKAFEATVPEIEVMKNIMLCGPKNITAKSVKDMGINTKACFDAATYAQEAYNILMGITATSETKEYIDLRKVEASELLQIAEMQKLAILTLQQDNNIPKFQTKFLQINAIMTKYNQDSIKAEKIYHKWFPKQTTPTSVISPFASQ